METFRKSVAAGLLIGIASVLFVSMFEANKLAAAILFSFALFFICLLGLFLFTGKIGWALSGENPWWWYLLVLAGNIVGTLLVGVMAWLAFPDGGLMESAQTLIDAKSACSATSLFVKGMLCGVLMYLAVAGFKKGEGMVRYLGIFFCIPVFILCGFEHSIADAAYMFVAMRLDFFGLMLVIAAGNAVGSILAWAIIEKSWTESAT